MTKKGRRSIAPGELPVRFTAFFDGCCEPRNPGGTAGFGCVIFDRYIEMTGSKLGKRVYEHSGMIPASPTTSNNVAEYLAINRIMDWLIENNHQKDSCHAWGDSRLVICQLWGWPVIGHRWKIHGVDCGGKRGFYADSALDARRKLKLLPRLVGFWIPREQNNIADELSKAEVKRAGVEFRIQPE